MRGMIGEILIGMTLISEADLEEVLQLQQDRKQYQKVGELLVVTKKISYKKLYKALGQQQGIEVVHKIEFTEEIYPYLQEISLSFLKQYRCFPYKIEENVITVAMADLDHAEVLDDLGALFKCYCKPVLTPPKEVLEAMNQVYDNLSSLAGNQLEEINKEEDEDDLEELEKDLLEASDDEAPVIRFVNRLLQRAVKERVSDIHIEPYEKDLAIRFRVDGVLTEVMRQPKNVHAAISSRIKIMGGLNIAEKRLPQGGRIKIKLAGRDIDIRLSTLPTWFGERLVMRLLDQKQTKLDLANNGFTADNLNQIRSLIRQPHGIILVTGPTGSGKSTTLYSALSEINSSEKNIITVEDPVEYQIQGLSQVQVNKKIDMNFVAALREILRQDPDVVMIGEIRDKETADIAMQAAMTGHLVFSTLHTNDTASTPTRMIDMGVEPYLVSSTLIAILAQRLIRRLCPYCKVADTPSEEELNRLGLSSRTLPPGSTIFKANGCPECLQSGYSGRTGIYELMLLTDEVRGLIIKQAESSVIKRATRATGMKTLREDGALKVLQGITSIEEVVRVTQDEIG